MSTSPTRCARIPTGCSWSPMSIAPGGPPITHRARRNGWRMRRRRCRWSASPTIWPTRMTVRGSPPPKGWPSSASQRSASCWRASPAARTITPRCARSRRPSPDLPILIHHLGYYRADELPPLRQIEEVLRSAALPNIYLKVSGFAYAAQVKWDFPYSDTTWLVRTLYAHFGAHRLCWGSDYPVVRRYHDLSPIARGAADLLPLYPARTTWPRCWAVRWPVYCTNEATVTLVTIIGRGHSGTRAISHTFVASGAYMGATLNRSGDLVPPEAMYEACRVMARYVEWRGGLSWDFSRLHTMPIPDEFTQLIHAYLKSVLDEHAKTP